MRTDPAKPASPRTRSPRPVPRRAFAPGLTLRAGIAGLAALAALAACGSTPQRPIRPEFDLHDPNPTRRTQAVSAVAASRDTSQVSALIILLDDEDEAVRLAAGKALRDITGHDSGYRASASPEERARQMEAWRVWWSAQKSGTSQAPGRPASAPVPPPAPTPKATPTPPATGGTRVGPS